MGNRDEFTKPIKKLLAERVGYICSNSMCMQSTIGAQDRDSGIILIGEVAHICAAAPGGKRYDNKMTAQERSGMLYSVE